MRLGRFWRRLNAAQLAVLSFAGVILAGSLVLGSRFCVKGSPLSFVDALFTATSAVCVTGLTVVDTGSRFNFWGQAVVLLLIQVGGFGIMSFGTFILFIMGRKASLAVSDAVSGSYLKLSRYSLSELLRASLLLTAGVEAAGAFVLFFRFARDFSWPEALWLAVFHSVSAFCNAGFSLFPDSLVRYGGDLWVNLPVMLLIITGGLGFFVLIDLRELAGKRKHRATSPRLSFHSKLVLLMTGILLSGGALVIFLIERTHNLSGFGLGGAALRSLFQSVTARTAGFNTIEIEKLSNATLFCLIFLMFIGGAPGSMAGGIKVTTAGVIFITAWSRLRGLGTPSLFGRSVSRRDLERSVALLLLSVFLVSLMTLVLLITELHGISHVESRGRFLEILFECVSAFGTVGLSTGISPSLTVAGRLLLTFLMFAGRLGPLTLVYAIERLGERAPIKYPEEEIIIG